MTEVNDVSLINCHVLWACLDMSYYGNITAGIRSPHIPVRNLPACPHLDPEFSLSSQLWSRKSCSINCHTRGEKSSSNMADFMN